jgi:hypothetical protein
LSDILGQLSDNKRAAIKPVHMHYEHVCHPEESDEFGKIISSDTIEGGNTPIRKHPYRTPCLL